MEDLQIIQQILNGYHLEKKEIKRAKEIIRLLQIRVKNNN